MLYELLLPSLALFLGPLWALLIRTVITYLLVIISYTYFR